jgi:hypothetical protein
MKVSRLTLSLLTAVLAYNAADQSPAQAFVYTNCDGAVTWHHLARLYRDVCSAPDGSAVATALINPGWWGWFNTAPGTVAKFADGGTYSAGCTITNNNGRNEFGTVLRSAISGLNGLTYTKRSSCIFSAAEWVEGDVMIANDQTFTNEDESFWNWTEPQQGPVVISHELGHFIGLQHSESFDIMRGAVPYPLVGGVSSGLLGVGWSNLPFMDDAAGARFLYPGSGVTNVFVSAEGLFSGNIQANDFAGTISRCRGGTFSLTYTVGDNGTTDVSSTGFRVLLNQDPNSLNGAIDIYTPNAAIGAGGWFTATTVMTVPSTLPNGLYWIHYEIDTGHSISEVLETDNNVHSAMTLNVSC